MQAENGRSRLRADAAQTYEDAQNVPADEPAARSGEIQSSAPCRGSDWTCRPLLGRKWEPRRCGCVVTMSALAGGAAHARAVATVAGWPVATFAAPVPPPEPRTAPT